MLGNFCPQKSLWFQPNEIGGQIKTKSDATGAKMGHQYHITCLMSQA